jgi:hypothetical protein
MCQQGEGGFLQEVWCGNLALTRSGNSPFSWKQQNCCCHWDRRERVGISNGGGQGDGGEG